MSDNEAYFGIVEETDLTYESACELHNISVDGYSSFEEALKENAYELPLFVVDDVIYKDLTKCVDEYGFMEAIDISDIDRDKNQFVVSVLFYNGAIFKDEALHDAVLKAKGMK